MQVNRAEAVQHSFIQEMVNDEVKTAFKTFFVSDAFAKELRNKISFF